MSEAPLNRRPGRPRSEASKDAALRAAIELLVEVGLGRLTIEGIAERAKVGKRTIYRWWPTKGAIVVEAFLSYVAPQIAFPSTRSAVNDIKRQLRSVGAAYRGPSGSIIKDIITLGQTDPSMLATFIGSYIQPRRKLAEEALGRAIQNGELRADLDSSTAIDSLYGPILFRLLLGHAPLDDAFVKSHAEIVLRGLAP